jgi:C-terminal processing protease CtpA/Prc
LRNNKAASRFAQALLFLPIAALFLLWPSSTVQAQLSSSDRERGRVMLHTIQRELQKHYYDRTFHGVDLETRFNQADQALKKAASNSEMFGIIAQAVVDLDDTHTRFLPPPRAYKTEYGWRMQMIGQRCFIVAVKPKSDAETKGLKVGDEVLSVNGYETTRESLWKVQYTYYTLKPQPGMVLLVQSPGGLPREITVLSHAIPGKRIIQFKDIYDQIREGETEAYLHRHRYYDDLGDMFVWKMPQFDLSDGEVDDIMNKVAKRKGLLLDLRGNGGGLETTLKRLVGNVFDHDVKIGDLKRRDETIPMIAKSRGEKTFKGQIVVLVDSETGSAGELFARIMQIEKRGIVLGDLTAGAVMRSRIFQETHGTDQVIVYAISITDADITMTDGQSLEKTGVVPDEKLLISGFALAMSADPVLSHAAAKLGVELSPKKAGTLFPIEWER